MSVITTVDLTTPVQHGPKSPVTDLYPGHGGTKVEITYWVKRDYYVVPRIGTQTSDGILVAFSEPRLVAGDIFEYLVTYITLPNAWVELTSEPFTYPGFFPADLFGLQYRRGQGDVNSAGQVAQGSYLATGVYGRFPITRNALRKTVVDFFYGDPDQIVIRTKFAPTNGAFAELPFVANNVTFARNTGQKIDPMDPASEWIYEDFVVGRTNPSYVVYLVWCQTGIWLVADDTKVERLFPGIDIWRIENTYVRAR